MQIVKKLNYTPDMDQSGKTKMVWLVEFYTSWSDKCKLLEPQFASIADKYASRYLRFGRCNVGQWPELADRFCFDLTAGTKEVCPANPLYR